MGFTRELASEKPHIIKNALLNLLNKTVSLDVLDLDLEYELALDKHAFLASFETTDKTKPTRDPALLERWTHYRWIRLELNYLVNQKATLNRLTNFKKEITQLNDREVPALQDSIERAIQEDALNNVPITDSINILKQMSLQIIGTEHPTDPLSQKARDLLLHIARAIDEPKPNEEIILDLLKRLQIADAIPPAKYSVEEEVNRNINILLDKLYDNVPQFVNTILSAYKKYYGDASYLAHENDILAAIEGNQTSPSLLRDGAWPGFDADGNTNVTAATMKNAIRLHRIRSAEKHSAALEATIIETAKNIERDLRQTICQLNLKLFSLINKLDEKTRLTVATIQNEASQFLIDRKFFDLIRHYQNFSKLLSSLPVDEEKHSELNTIIQEQLASANTLVELTRLSGTHTLEKQEPRDDNPSPRREYVQIQGDLQAFKQLLTKYKDNIRENSDAINIENKPASQFVEERFHELLEKHRTLFNKYPELYMQMRYFGVQLHSFGMTYGVGHVRQDSSIFIKVWDALLDDLKTDPTFAHYAALKPLQGKSYNELTENERFALHKQLQDGSSESNKLLEAIFYKHSKSRYLQEKKYQQPKFHYVREELARIDLALKHDDLFENIIISNSESAANILEVESLLAIFPKRPKQRLLRVVPLLEKREDLENYKRILTDYIEMKAQQSKANGTKATVEIMVGFSDTERVSGIAALIDIQRVKENFIKLANKHGVTPKIYHGPGGDPNRGGLKRRDQKATLQGNARSNVLNTAKSTQWYRENQFYQTHQLLSDPYSMMELTRLPDHLKTPLDSFTKAGTGFYEHLHDTQNGLGQLMSLLLGNGAYWMTTILNSSSRATQRGIADSMGDRTAFVQTQNLSTEEPEALYVDLRKVRAITATQAKEMLRDNLDFVGVGCGLQKIGQASAEKLYFSSETFRDIVEKSLLGEATRDLSFLAHTLFADHPELLPANAQQESEWANECRDVIPEKLKAMDILAMSKDPAKHMELLTLLSRLFAYLSADSRLTREYLLAMNHSIHQAANASPTLAQPTDLLFHAPAWQAQVFDAVQDVEPLSYLFARQSHHVARNNKLDQVYVGLNTQVVENSSLKGVGRLLANVGCGITAFRQMQPGLTENMHHDYRPNLHEGETRAEAERHRFKLFGNREKQACEVAPLLNEVIEKKHAEAQQRKKAGVKDNSPMR